jgi:hypothetical protein
MSKDNHLLGKFGMGGLPPPGASWSASGRGDLRDRLQRHLECGCRGQGHGQGREDHEHQRQGPSHGGADRGEDQEDPGCSQRRPGPTTTGSSSVVGKRSGGALLTSVGGALSRSSRKTPLGLSKGAPPSRASAVLELVATVACVALSGPPLTGGRNAPLGPRKGTLRLAGAFTDNKGNAYAAARFHSAKPPLSCIVMALATQLEARGPWMVLHWTPSRA